MNPMLAELVGAFVRWFVTTAIGLLLAQHVISTEQGDRFLTAWTSPESIAYVVALLATLAWSWWAKYRSRLKLVTGLAMSSGSSEADVETHIRENVAGSVTLSKNEAPFLSTQLKG